MQIVPKKSLYLLHVSCYENNYKYNSKWNNNLFDLFQCYNAYTQTGGIFIGIHTCSSFQGDRADIQQQTQGWTCWQK